MAEGDELAREIKIEELDKQRLLANVEGLSSSAEQSDLMKKHRHMPREPTESFVWTSAIS